MRIIKNGTCVIANISAEIEHEYAKRLSKLAKTSLGKYETGYVFI